MMQSVVIAEFQVEASLKPVFRKIVNTPALIPRNKKKG
jgi:hypothetical protein